MTPDPSLLSKMPWWLYCLLLLACIASGPFITGLWGSRTSRTSTEAAKDAARDVKQERLMQDVQDERDAMDKKLKALDEKLEKVERERDEQRKEHERQMAEMRTLMREQEERHLLVVAAHQERERVLAEFAAGLRIDIIEGKGPPPRDWPL